MKAYPIFWLNSDNFTGVVTSESELTNPEILKIFCQHYTEHLEDIEHLFVGDLVKHVHTK